MSDRVDGFVRETSRTLRRRYGTFRTRYERRIAPWSFRNWSKLEVGDFNRSATSMEPAMYEGRLYEKPGFELRRLGVPTRSVYPAYAYAKPDPRVLDAGDFLPELIDECDDQRSRFPGGAEVREATLKEALIFADAVYVRQGRELTALYESSRENDRTVLLPIARQDLSRIRVLPGRGDTVFLSSPGSHNFGHWLTDDLTRVVASRAGRRTTWLMTDRGELMNDRRRESLRLALNDPAACVRFIAPNEPLLVRNLRYASRATYHPSLKSPEAVAATRTRVSESLGERSPGVGRLFIARRREAASAGMMNADRGLINTEEILGLLTSRGFSVLDPLSASAEEQARACARAGTIVGVMGAAMTNSMFAHPGTAVVHLAARGWVEPYYWDLATVCGHEYRCVFGDTQGEGSPWLLPFRIDPQTLTSVLDELDRAAVLDPERR